MNLTPKEIARLARRAGVRFGEHAFIVVQDAGGCGRITERTIICDAKNRDQVKADADAHAIKRKRDYPSSDFFALEVGAPADGAELIERLASLIEEAMDNHIYDADNGEAPEADCGYQRAVTEARAFLASRQVFTPPAIGALEVMADLEGAVQALDHQVDQMKGLFGDEDGAIELAQEDAAEAIQRAKMYREATQPAHIFVTVEGGNVQGVTCDRPLTDLKITVIDYDVDEEDQVIYEIEQGPGGKWAVGRADQFSVEVFPGPSIREIGTAE